MTTSVQEFPLIDTPAALRELCHRIGNSPWLALDTEFMREKTYQPQFCLLQLATPELIACIDPLVLDDLGPLLDIIYAGDTLKILHAARQDLEIFFHLRGHVPQPLYDTQIAASLLTRKDQIGYATLVEQTLGISLEKGHTRTDWSRRPLDAGQLRYAADDVRYLGEIHARQVKALEAQGRLQWLNEDFTELATAELYQVDPRESWRRVKDHRKLKGVQLAVLRELAAWREQRAIHRNRPRKWILKDEVLVELARRMPGTTAALAKIHGLETGNMERAGKALLQCIASGRAQPRDQWPTLTKVVATTPEQEALADAMMAVVRLIASEQGLSPTMLATRRSLEQFLLGDASCPLRHGWRRRLVGERLEALCQGRELLRVVDGRLSLLAVAS